MRPPAALSLLSFSLLSASGCLGFLIVTCKSPVGSEAKGLIPAEKELGVLEKLKVLGLTETGGFSISSNFLLGLGIELEELLLELEELLLEFGVRIVAS